ncbi:MAG: oligosaccharide flippase family protein [Pseudomonadota bacterium]
MSRLDRTMVAPPDTRKPLAEATMLRPLLLTLSGNATASATIFARNLLLAAMLPVGDYGIAATFAIAMAAIETASALGVQQQIVQARDGDDPKLQAALHGFQILRGLFAATILLALSGPLARFLGIPDVAWAYAILAAVPLIQSFQHLDIHRFSRDERFLPVALSGVLPNLLALALAGTLAWLLGDWRAMLWSLLFQAICLVAITHVFADRPWRLRADAATWRRVLTFGAPLLVNGLILFVVLQGDKLIVGRVLGMETLGVFALATTLTLTPALVIAAALQTVLLPRLSRARDAGSLPAAIQPAIAASCAAGGLAATLAVLAGPAVAPFVAGTGYAALATLLLPLGVLQAIRMAKAAVTLVALALGQTSTAMVSNIPRLIALAIGAWAVTDGATIQTLIWIACLGEAAGVPVALWRVTRAKGWTGGLPAAPFIWTALAVAATLSVPLLSVPGWIAAAVAGTATLACLHRSKSVGIPATGPGA